MQDIKPLIDACCMCEGENGIWFIHGNLPILFFFDFDLKKITISKIIPIESNNMFMLFSSIVMNDNLLFLICGNQDKSYIYNIDEDKFTELKINGSYTNAFYGATRKHKELHIMPFKYDNIIKVDMNKFFVENGDNWRKLYNNMSLYINNTNCILDNGDVLAPVPTTNTCLLYDLNNEVWKKIEICDINADCTAVTYYNHKIYVFDRYDKSIKRIDMKGNIEKKVELEIVGVVLYMIGNYLIVDSVYTKDIIVFDYNLNEVKTIEKNMQSNNENLQCAFLCWYKNNDKNYVITKSNKLIVIYDNLKTREYKLTVDNTMLSDIISSLYYIYGKKVIIENDWLNINSFIEKQVKGDKSI